MKRFFLLLMTLSLLLCAAQAEEPPGAVKRLCAEAYPGYAVLVADGYDDGATGQWAVILHKDGDNALIIAEKTNAGAYALTVNNPNAVPDEGEGYSCDTHAVSVQLKKHYAVHDRLGEFEMVIEQPDVMKWVITSELSDDRQTWTNVISEYTFMNEDEHTVWWSHVFAEDHSLNYMRHTETPEGKPLRTDVYPRVPVRGEAGKAHLLNEFNASLYPYTPDLINGAQIADYAGDWLGQTTTLKQLSLKPDQLILLTENQTGERMLHIIPWVNNQYHGTMLAGPLPAGASLDLFHAGDDALILEWQGEDDGVKCGFASLGAGAWRLEWVMGAENLRFTYNSVACAEETTPLRNDGVHYGRLAWEQITDMNFEEIPMTLEEALAQLDQSGYAVVNNPNPEDRLHLRELPRKDARSFGKFYNRTPVRVYAIEGEWARVSVGSITGYMMTKYLAFGDEMDSVKCAFPQEVLVEEVQKVALRPYREGKTPGMLDRETAFYIVGVEGERYVILTEDGTTGYLDQSYFYPGNG